MAEEEVEVGEEELPEQVMEIKKDKISTELLMWPLFMIYVDHKLPGGPRCRWDFESKCVSCRWGWSSWNLSEID